MGKKSRRRTEDGNQPASSTSGMSNQNTHPQASAATSNGGSAPVAEPVQEAYRSDGPSEEDLNCYQTSSASLQVKLNQLKHLAAIGDRESFVRQFVPMDLSDADTMGYLQDLTTAEEAEGQWTNLASEICALADGKGVQNIEGDQETQVIFYFEHPLLKGCDREVSFVYVGGEWRAEG
jgi:hypothetical protein